MTTNPSSLFSTAGLSGPVWKLGIIGFLILVLMIPVVWIGVLIKERHDRQSSVISEISAKLGGVQVVSGPFLSVPYQVLITDSNDLSPSRARYTTRYLQITPTDLKVTGKVSSTLQRRGIFKVPGYTASLDLVGDFPMTNPSEGLPQDIRPDWSKAILTFDLSDSRGLKQLTGSLNDQPLRFTQASGILHVSRTAPIDQPAPGRPSVSTSSVDNASELDFHYQAALPLGLESGKRSFKLRLSCTGTQQLSFLASALQEVVDLKGDWPSPSFNGDLLPVSRQVSASGFSGIWQTNYLSSGNKAFWTSDEPALRLATLGVSFLIPVDAYQQTTRALKYSILFLLLTFMTFFFTETIARQRIHPIQYLMVGCSLVIFYLLLLSITEHLSFGWSYLIAALGVILQVGLYCYSILHTRKFALQVSSILAGVYAFLYVLLRLEDSALLVGSIGLFVLLGIAMYVIRNINWYNKE